MRSSIEWLEDGVNAVPEERATLAEWRLLLNEQNVCLHLEGDDSVDQVTLPLYHIAEGLAHKWWRLFGGRDEAVSLIEFRRGHAVPDVRIHFDGAALEISAHQKIYRNPDVRFWSGSSETLVRAEGEAQLSQLVETVLERLGAEHRTALQLRWARVLASRADPQEAEFCEAAGALGLDPYNIDQRTARLIEQSAGVFTGETLVEFLGGLRGPPERVDAALDWVETCERRPQHRRRLPELRDRARRAARSAPDRAEPAWARGYRRARALRRALDIGPTEALAGYKAVAQRLGAPWFEIAPSVDGVAALRSDRDDGVYLHVRRQGREPQLKTSHTFAFARGIGDAACFPEPSRAVANELHDSRRQAAGRAFAAEFLAPSDGVQGLLREGRDGLSVAAHYGVSPAVIERQTENARRIADACAA